MSQEISIVIPTITSREDWLARCIRGYKLTAPEAEIITILNAPSCGEAWRRGAKTATRAYVHFTADDIVPAYDWWNGALYALDDGIVPAANVREDGRLVSCDAPMGTLGQHWKVMVPFLSRGMLDQGGWFLPIHAGSDDWITYRAAQLGYPIKFCPDYVLHHYVAPEGRTNKNRLADLKALVAAMEEAGYVPPFYAHLRGRLG